MRQLLYVVFIVVFPAVILAQDSTKVDSVIATTRLATLSGDFLEEESSDQDVSGLLQASRDVFASAAGYNFGPARYRMRGYDNSNYLVCINGVVMNSPYHGRAIWGYWGGLNDITRYQQTVTGINANEYNFGGLAGTSNMSTWASGLRKGSRVSFALSNRSYRNRLMFTHSTGMMSNGWAVSVSGSTRWAEEGYVEGTNYSGGSYFLSVDKKIGEKHLLNATVLGAPTVRGGRGIVVEEATALIDNNYYNPYWGYQNGEKRNARERRTHQPIVLISDKWQINEKMLLTGTYMTMFGKNGRTNLNWFDAADPRPDYYKNLPSFYGEPGDEFMYDKLTEAWKNDEAYRQIKWDDMIYANQKNLYSLDDANGTNEKLVGNRSKYIVEELREDASQHTFNAVLNYQKADNLKLYYGLNYTYSKTHNFKIVDDLLGGDFWVDVDQFALRDFSDDEVAQNDISTPNRVVYEGDIVGYNYEIIKHQTNGFIQVEYTKNKLDFFFNLGINSTSFYRNGLMQNGRFKETSKGESSRLSYLNAMLKAGATYKLSGRHMLSANFATGSRSPMPRNVFVSPRTHNGHIIADAEKVNSFDLNYLIRYPNVKGRVSFFNTTINDQVWQRSFYHEEYRTLVNFIMEGVDNLHTGVELGLEVKASPTVAITTAFSTGQYTYNSRPRAYLTRDNSAEFLAEYDEVYLKNYRMGGMPQTVASLGVKYFSSKYWFAGITGNYFADIYLDANPARRTTDAIDLYVESDPQWQSIIGQTKLENQFTLDFFGGKSWRINDNYLRVNLNVSNILNNTDFATGGFEQLRFDASDIDRFPARIGYLYGTTFFAGITYQF